MSTRPYIDNERRTTHEYHLLLNAGIPEKDAARLALRHDSDWKTRRQLSLEDAIDTFKKVLPGWWYSLGECERSCDASCGPTRESVEIALVGTDDRFNSGFHVDLAQPSTLFDALCALMEEVLEALPPSGALESSLDRRAGR